MSMVSAPRTSDRSRANVLGLSLTCLALSIPLGVSGCQSCGQSVEEPGATPGPAVEPGDTGEAEPEATNVLEGFVRLAEGADLPRLSASPMASGPGRPPLPPTCSPPGPSDQTPVRLTEGRGLAGVLVALSDFSVRPEHEPQVVNLTIRDCRLEPRFVAAVIGDTLRIENETDYPFLPNLGEGLTRALLYERTRDVELSSSPGSRVITCGFAAPCGQADIFTLAHPLFAITDENGHYRLEGAPLGESFRASAWHPLFQEDGHSMSFNEAGEHNQDFELNPAPTAQPSAPPADPDDPNQLF